MIIHGVEKESPQQRCTLQKLFDATLPPNEKRSSAQQQTLSKAANESNSKRTRVA
jgi:hypothetical protein